MTQFQAGVTNSKNRMIMSGESKKPKSNVKARNPLTLNPLMRKSHVHGQSIKSERAKGKQDLLKELKEQLKEG
ncbi:MAG: hypothetical protein HKN85_06870 [Gammaproteobacteria bacterium]|nr:hypothetical protein [Gammaproteobacteria bacterium]